MHRSTFLAKLLALVAISTVSSILVLWVSISLSNRVQSQLVLMRDQYVPLIELGPDLEARFEALKRGFQDSVAASDPDALAATQEQKARFLDRLAVAQSTLDPEVSAKLRGLVETYYSVAYDVSRRMIAGETGEATIDAIRHMQERSEETAGYLKKATAFDKTRLLQSFTVALAAQDRAATLRLVVSLCGVALVCAFSFWVTKNVMRTLGTLLQGLERFGHGSFEVPIPVTTADELGEVAAHANRMAENLRRLSQERERVEWINEGLAGLSEVNRGEATPRDTATVTLHFLAKRVSAVAGAVYVAMEGGRLELASHSGFTTEGAVPLPKHVHETEGLLGRAASEDDVLHVRDVPADFLRIESGLGASQAAELILMPLRVAGRLLGVIELAFFTACPSQTLEFLRLSRERIAIAFEAARSRAAMKEVLEETQQQAGRLTVQEEELREANGALTVQQEELRTANEALEANRRALGVRNAELEEAHRTLEERAQELGRVSAYKSQFLANMSHELRTPLNSMLLLSHLLSKNDTGNLTLKQVEYCKTVHAAGKDLLNLINQILDLAKIEAGRQEIYVEPVELEDIIEHLRGVFAPLAADRGLGFTIDLAADAPRVIETDRNRLDRILTNLLGNAIKFTSQGAVSLEVARVRPGVVFRNADLDPRDVVAFAVKDSGIGIPHDALERVFAPFEQLEAKTDRRYGGSGLGLAISRESATLLGGELQVVSVPGEGSTFTCYLPASRSPAAREQQSKPSPRPASDRAAAAAAAAAVKDDRSALDVKEAYLLVIEDDAVLGEQLVELIHAHRLKAVLARSGEEGLALAKAKRPRGIILDVKLPDIDGWSVMDRLRRDPSTSGVPVHFISGVDTPERGLALGAVGYLTKPVTREDLVSVVRALAPGSFEESSGVLVVEDNDEAAESLQGLLDEEGMSMHRVGTAGAAVEMLRSRRFGCMILDLGLPDMDGLELLELLHQESSVDRPPVVVYTGRALTREETRRLDAYVQAVVVKDGNSEERLLDELRLFVGHVKDALPKAPAARELPTDAALQGRTVVVADDDMRTVYAVSALLRGKGAEVLVAENGIEALALLRKHPETDGVLMDIMMPEMDGYEAMRHLRRDARFASLPVIALTAKAMKGERDRCLEAGATEYLPKPIDGDELLKTLQRLMPARKVA